ncbi:DUF2252 domain-containing protein [Leifsonia shinshuensis]|uniref:Uncharacterized protein (DUF2252 family) n=1 Tax=Leifsonia shinshuensis TaxID=150026 RepID=A0A853CR90_9MICO|nr:DUF2252 domain-containing protein [Leifsonia shinshuensis]NYJ22423.1 uncharacterized protein (DUF2252 family) [Leifsonia shinshuensis]
MTAEEGHLRLDHEAIHSAADLFRAGKDARSRLPRSSHGEYAPAADRDPVGILKRQHQHRVAELIPLRLERMTANPFAFYRGSAAIQAADLAPEPRTGVDVTICGDAHIANFGLFASPERSLVFDLNDFDESAYGAWEWDLKRFLASVVLAARQRGFGEPDIRIAALEAAAAYRIGLRQMTRLDVLERYYVRADVTRFRSALSSQQVLDRAIEAASRRTSARVVRKITQRGADGAMTIVENPPRQTHVPEATEQNVLSILRSYLDTVPTDIAVLLSQYVPTDAARRVVGVGSVGTRCYIIVLTGPAGEPLVLQVKEASESVAVEFGGAPAGRSPVFDDHAHDDEHGHRVVGNQRVLQAVSDPFLGYARQDGHAFYIRQFRDHNVSIDTEELDFRPFADYVDACGTVLARAHAQSPNAPFIAGYLGSGTTFDVAVVEWAIAYADQAHADYLTVRQAVADGEFSAAAAPAPLST